MLPKTAKAAVFTKPGEPFALREFPLLEPKEGTILVKLARTNVCGSDIHIWKGEAQLEKFGITYPMVLGHEMAGRVAALGPGVTSDSRGETLKEGDLVTYAYFKGCGRCVVCARRMENACLMSLASIVRNAEQKPHFVGGFAEYYYLRPGQRVYKVPEGLTEEIVAGANCALTQVTYGLKRVRLSLGESIVVQGAGGLGIYATAVAKAMGAKTVIVIDGIESRLELAKEFGADHTVNISQIKEPAARVNLVQGLTGGGADVVVEVVGIPEVLKEGIRMIQRGGRYLVMGSINPNMTYNADPSMWVGQNVTLYGVSLYDPYTLWEAVEFLRQTHDRLPYEKLFSHTFPLEQINEAFAKADAFAKDKTEARRVSVVMG